MINGSDSQYLSGMARISVDACVYHMVFVQVELKANVQIFNIRQNRSQLERIFIKTVGLAWAHVWTGTLRQHPQVVLVSQKHFLT